MSDDLCDLCGGVEEVTVLSMDGQQTTGCPKCMEASFHTEIAMRDAEIERLRAENARTCAALTAAQDAAQRAAHVIIQEGVVPGASCRCADCRSVARRMADAGYLAEVPKAERWWEAAERAAEEER